MPAQAASLQVEFPQKADVTVVQGSSTNFTIDVEALGATDCDATTAPVLIERLYSVNAAGDIASAQAVEMPIKTAETRGSSGNCYIETPVKVPLTATAAAETAIGDYKGVLRYGKGGDGDIDLDGPELTIHVVAPPAQEPEVLPPPALAPPEIIVLGERVVALRPKLGKSVMLAPVSGSVTYREPGKGVVTLTKTTVVPNGTLVDATRGTVKVTVERDRAGGLDSVDTWGGSFRASQSAAKRPVTTFTLAGRLTTARKVASAAAKRKSRSRSKNSLWVNGKGNFKTRGKRASAIVRGTMWLTQETSAGTKVSVRTGLVAVRDLVKKRTVLVSAGKSYLARIRTAITRRVPAFTGSV